MPADAEARTDVWRLGIPPTVFIVHFGAVYGWTGLGCSFGWGSRTVGSWGLIPLVVIVLTLLALLALWWAAPGRVADPAPDVDNPYDPGERRHFLATTSRMTATLSAVGVLLVGASSLLARTCAIGA